MLTLLLIVMLTLIFNIQPVKSDWTWTKTIYIRANGSVDPLTAPISSADNITYTLTDNIVGDVPEYTSAIVVERDNIVVDGAGYTLQGTGAVGSRGIILSGRSNVTIKNIKIKAFANGIYLSGSSSNSITGNNITNNTWGIQLSGSSNNIISGNNITANGGGIYLDGSSNNVLRNNSMADNPHNIGVWGDSLSDFVNDVDASNTVDGKPVYYWINRRDEAIPLDAGYVALINCTNIAVQNLKLTKCWQGVLLVYTTNSTITKNHITNNDYGIRLYYSSGNIISGNNITNNDYGIFLDRSSNNNTISGNNITNNNYRSVALRRSSNNKFYHNNFIDNARRVYTYESGYANFWDDGYPSGGNYWSDCVDYYSGVDFYSSPDQDQLGSDGIGDTSYIIDNDNIDHYPLISPFPQTPDFDIAVFLPTGTTAQGTTVTTNVYVSTIAGYDYLVSLSASGQPEGITINFNPNTGTPYFTSTMTIQVGDSVPTNTYSITITGLGADGKTHSTTYTLTVTPAAVPEFPLGGAIEIALMLAIVFIWLKKRHKILRITVP